MTAIDVNGFTVTKLRINAPIASGTWSARVEALLEAPLSGAVTVSDGANPWRGTVVEAGVVQGLSSALVVGGAGGLRKKLPARSYVGVTARSVVQDILNAVGEQASRAALTSPQLRTVLPYWTRSGPAPDGMGGTAAEQLQAVLDAVGATWRVLASGQVWIGTPAFLRSAPTGFVELDREPTARRVHAALDALDLFPDTSVQNERVGDVEYRLEGSRLRATYWLEAA
jgi:hypothetical protein